LRVKAEVEAEKIVDVDKEVEVQQTRLDEVASSSCNKGRTPGRIHHEARAQRGWRLGLELAAAARAERGRQQRNLFRKEKDVGILAYNCLKEL
jgi:hypothetical protein